MFSLIDFLTLVKSAVQFSVKCVKYVHFFAHFLTFVAFFTVNVLDFLTVNVFDFLAFVDFLTLKNKYSATSICYKKGNKVHLTMKFVTSLAFVAFFTVNVFDFLIVNIFDFITMNVFHFLTVKSSTSSPLAPS